ncbi:MAG: hypothetical protein JKY43_11125 [Phycisphaerales bacterium]|nr:hypothetical protein [Phycisphaerales bacterium]
MKNRMILVIAAICFVQQATADLIETFQDGDYTHNPVWFVSNSPGSDEIRADQQDPNNLVLAMHGTNTAHHRLATEVTTSWVGFQLSVDFRADGNHNTDFQLLSNLPNDTPPSLSMRWTRADDASGLVLRNGGVDISSIAFDIDITNTWTTLSVWHDVETDLVSVRVTDALTGLVLGSSTVSFGFDFSTAGDIGFVSLGAEETSWQYFDNIQLTTVPSPGTLTGFALCCGCLLNRRR